MKKFISFVMAGAMIASLVPATAFAAKGEVTATAKVIDAWERAKDFDGKITGTNAPEVQLKVSSVDYQLTAGEVPTAEIKVSLDNAKFIKTSSGAVDETTIKNSIKVSNASTGTATKVYHYTTVALESDATALKGLLKNYYDNGTDLTDTLLNAAATITAAEGGATAAAGSTTFKLKNVATLDSTMYTASPATQMDAALNTFLATSTATFADYSYVADSAAYGKEVYVKNMGATGDGPAYFSRAAFLTSAGKSSMSEFTGTKEVYATWEGPALTALQSAIGAGNGLYKESYTTTAATGGAMDDTAITLKDVSEDQLTIKITGFLTKDSVISMKLLSVMDSTSEGKKATVSVDSKMAKADDLVYASILGKGLKVSIRKTVDVAQDEVVTLNSSGLKIESAVGDFAVGTKITLKINNGFEFVKTPDPAITVDGSAGSTVSRTEDNELTLTVGTATDELTVKNIKIEATSAKSGATATITAKSNNMDSASCEVAKVVDYKVNLTVDKDEDLPVIYSGTDVKNTGLTDDSDHMSLEVTAKESFPGAWSMRQGFNFNLPDGVYVTGINVTGADNFKKGTSGTAVSKADWVTAFEDAYQDGDHKNFEFKKRVFNDVDTVLAKDPAELKFELELVADPTFEGDVKLTFDGALVDKQEVTIAKFVKPYTVKAEQNDVIIDYRNTEVKTPIVITEAEEGLWKKDTTFKLNIEDDLLTFENDPTFTIDKDSDLKLKDDKADKGTIKFSVKEESDKAATVTISDMKLFMSRSIPAGAYDLEISTTMKESYDRQKLFAPDEETKTVVDWKSGDRPSESSVKKDSYVDDVCDYSDVVKAAFINVVTSGRDNDNLFTTKVVVPVGEAYLLAGEAKVELDAPAYISAAGYTMLPVRAISKALGVNTNNVLWNAETRTVTIMYAQRIITMTVGQKTIYVNGSAIPSSAAPEIKDGRTFLPLRDLGTALGVTNVNWDAATKTATLN